MGLWDALYTCLRIRDAFVATILQWAFPFKIFYQTDGYVKGEISPSRSRLIYATLARAWRSSSMQRTAEFDVKITASVRFRTGYRPEKCHNGTGELIPVESLLRIAVSVFWSCWGQFLCAFAKLRKATIGFVVCLSFYPSAHLNGTTRLPLDRFSWNLNIFWKYVEKIQVSPKSDKNNW